MSKPTIVTAFFDIGRGNWTPDKGLPAYLLRTTDTYMERFGHLATLDNDMVIFTTPDQMPRIRELRKDKIEKTILVSVAYPDMFHVTREAIWTIQQNKDFLKMIDPGQVRNPEYWSPDYVLVNYLKSFFVNTAIRMGHVRTDLVAWVDFGYCRDKNALNGVTSWNCNLSNQKMHLFNFREYTTQPIQRVIATNTVYMFGAKIIGGHEPWKEMEKLMANALEYLVSRTLIDDDQTLLLLSYLQKKELFELHSISEGDPFVLFRNFNA